MTETSPIASKLDWLASVATILSIVACYGTLLVIGALSLLGISLALNTGVWAGVIVLFAILAVAGIALGYQQHHELIPLILAFVGAALIVWVMFGSFNRALELIGFTVLIVAATWDWRLKKRNAATKHLAGSGS